MTRSRTILTRRHFAAMTGAAVLFPATATAQDFVDFEAFAARCRELSGFDPMPRNLVANLAAQMSAMEKRAVIDGGGLRDDMRKRLLRALYTGVYEPAGQNESTRIGYQDALMYAAIEDSVNVPSYCGGLPAFWSEKPAVG